MATIEHKDIVDPNVHEPKGASSASTGTVYKSNGAGSGTWSKVKGSELDAESSTAGQVLVSTGAGSFAYSNPSNELKGRIKAGSFSFGSYSPVKMSPSTTTSGKANGFTEGTNARITYTGSESRLFLVSAYVDCSPYGGYVINVAKNGAVASGPCTEVSAGRYSGTFPVLLNNGDYIEVFGSNASGGSTPFNALHLSVTEA